MTCIVSIVWLIFEIYSIKEIGFSPLVSLLGGLSGLIASSISIEASEKDPANYRRIMLNQVKNLWVKGVLEKSIQSESLIELGLEERNCAIKFPLDKVLQTPINLTVSYHKARQS